MQPSHRQYSCEPSKIGNCSRAINLFGDSPWYAGLAENMQSIQLPLSALPPGQTTITYPDSFTAMGLGTDLGLGHPGPATGACSSSANCPAWLRKSACRI